MNNLKIIDRQPYTLQLNYKSRLTYKSKTGGFISLMFYLACAVVIGLNFYYFITQDQFIYEQVQIKNDLGPIWISRDWFGIKLVGTNKTHQFLINTQNQQQYGIKVYVEQVTNINGSDTSPKISAVDGQATNAYDFRDFFMFPKDFNMTLSGRSDVQTKTVNYSRLGIIVKNISTNISQTLELVNLTAKLIFINNVTNPKFQHPIIDKKIRIFYIRDGLPLIYNQLQQLTLYFRKIFFQTDTGKFFFNNPDQFNTTFYDQEQLTSIVSNNQKQDDWLVQIKFKRSLFTIRYDRNYKKFSTYLAQTFGVIGLVSIVFLVYNGYNKWRFTEKQLIPKKNRKSTNIFRYYWNLLQNLKKISTESSFAYSQFQQKLDIHKIIQKLNDFQARLRKLQGRSTLIIQDSDIISQKNDKNRQNKNKNQYKQQQIIKMSEQFNQIKEQLLENISDPQLNQNKQKQNNKIRRN